MDEIESLHRLVEAVETAGADIAPTYIEYVQLAFAIATDCGEAGRDYFHRICRLSAKYQRETRRTGILQRAHHETRGRASGHSIPSR